MARRGRTSVRRRRGTRHTHRRMRPVAGSSAYWTSPAASGATCRRCWTRPRDTRSRTVRRASCYTPSTAATSRCWAPKNSRHAPNPNPRRRRVPTRVPTVTQLWAPTVTQPRVNRRLRKVKRRRIRRRFIFRRRRTRPRLCACSGYRPAPSVRRRREKYRDSPLHSNVRLNRGSSPRTWRGDGRLNRPTRSRRRSRGCARRAAGRRSEPLE
mmetsp:Transcript_13308/g.36418  ORF Transcript_13308/g.36418 Transcript_13308/m.36418 type:complete len:211 (+) Transcript_13308:1461-2093(+)